MFKADLHIHTTVSDGLKTPEEIVDLAKKNKLYAISITDHDTVGGIQRAIDRAKLVESKTKIIPGIELSSSLEDKDVHILGYFINYHSKNLLSLSKKLMMDRAERVKKMIDKLNKLGVKITLQEVKKQSKNNYIGRPHIAKALQENNYVNGITEAFDLYLERGKPAYVERYKLNINECIKLIHDIGGIAVLAHPGLINNLNIVNKIINMDIDGIEVVHSKHKCAEMKTYRQIALEHNLMITGGSDYHGGLKDGEPIFGKYYIDLTKSKKLFNCIEKFEVKSSEKK